jgi:hypothetical protein
MCLTDFLNIDPLRISTTVEKFALQLKMLVFVDTFLTRLLK